MVLGTALAAHGADAPGSAVARAEALIQQGREMGLRAVNQKDGKAKDAAKRNFEEAEKLLKEEVKRDPGCQACLESLAGALFYRAYFQVGRSFDDSIELTNQGLARFPASGLLAFFKGYSHYNKGEHDEALHALKRYLGSGAADAQSRQQVEQLIQECQQRFLGTWYHQASFYQSGESRIEQFNPQTLKNEIAFQFTPEYEANLGQQAFTQLTSSAPPAQDGEADAYLQQLVQRLVGKTPGPNFNYQVTIVNSPDVNAVTPPGHIVMFTGLLAFVDSESQLAGVLSHELAHNYAHHVARRVIKQYQAQQVVDAVARAVNPKTQAAQFFTQLGASVGLGLFVQAYSRFEEKEADLYGTHILYNAGYNPTAMSEFFLKMYGAAPKQPIKFLSTHPPLPDRVEYLTAYLESYALDRELAVDSDMFKKIKARYPSAHSGDVMRTARGALPPIPGAPPAPNTPGAPPDRSRSAASPTAQTSAPPPVPSRSASTGEPGAPAPTRPATQTPAPPPSPAPASTAPPPAPTPPALPRPLPPSPSDPRPEGKPSPAPSTEVGRPSTPPSTPAPSPSDPRWQGKPAPPPPSTGDTSAPSATSTAPAKPADDPSSLANDPRWSGKPSSTSPSSGEAAPAAPAKPAANPASLANDPRWGGRPASSSPPASANPVQPAAAPPPAAGGPATSVLRSPAPSVTAGGPRDLGVWGPESGAPLVAFRDSGQVVSGVLEVLPENWPASKVQPGNVVFLDGRRDGDLIRGVYVNLPQQDECPFLPPKYSSATIQFDLSGLTMTLTTTEYKYWADSCKWSDVFETKTYTWRRVR